MYAYANNRKILYEIVIIMAKVTTMGGKAKEKRKKLYIKFQIEKSGMINEEEGKKYVRWRICALIFTVI